MPWITDWHMSPVDWAIATIVCLWLLSEIANLVYFKPKEKQRLKTLDEVIGLMDEIEKVMVRLHEPLTDEMLDFLGDVEGLHIAIKENRFNPDPEIVSMVKVSMTKVKNQLFLTEKDFGDDHALA